MASKNAIIAGVVVVIVAVAAVAAYVLINNDKNDTHTFGVGDSQTFIVFGNIGDDGTLIDGTMTYKLLDETETQYKLEMEQSIYTVDTDGKRAAMNVGTSTEWEDKTSDDENLVSKGTLTVNTFWGKKTLSYYESKDGESKVLSDGDIVYAMMFENDDVTMYMELTDCSAIKSKKVDRDVHEATIVMNGNLATSGVSVAINMTFAMDNKKTEIFTKMTTSMGADLNNNGNFSEISSGTSWNDPFDSDTTGMVKTGTERISTEWGTKETDVYKKVENGETRTMYSYKDVPVRMIFEEEAGTITLDATSIIIDGKSATLDEAAEL